MSEQEKTRRETLKLAAAVAAFGTALGFRRTAEATGSTTPGTPPTPPTTKTEIKMMRVELKLYDGDKLLHSCAVPPGQLKFLKLEGGRVEHKAYVNGVGWDLKANKRV